MPKLFLLAAWLGYICKWWRWRISLLQCRRRLLVGSLSLYELIDSAPSLDFIIVNHSKVRVRQSVDALNQLFSCAILLRALHPAAAAFKSHGIGGSSPLQLAHLDKRQLRAPIARTFSHAQMPRRWMLRLAAFGMIFPALTRPQPTALALQAPKGNVILLVPILECRVLLAELGNSALLPADRRPPWVELRAKLNQPPFTDDKLPREETRLGARREVGLVGNLLRKRTLVYEENLMYNRTLTGSDRKVCFPRTDEECLRLSVNADLDLRDLLRNELLENLDLLEDELAFRMGCDKASCGAEADYLEKTVRDLNAAFDQYLNTIPATEIQEGMKVVASSFKAASNGKLLLQRVETDPVK